MGARKGASVGTCPPWKIKKKLRYVEGISATYSPYGGLFATFFSLGGSGAFSPCGGLFDTFFPSRGGGGIFCLYRGPFLGLPLPPPPENFYDRPWA